MSFTLPSTLTYWTPTANNSTGGKIWSAPKTTATRSAQSDAVSFDANGKEYKVNKSYYVRVDIPIGSYVAIGDTAELEPTRSAQLVKSVNSNHSFVNMFKLMT